jgi:exocyst complex component 3
MILLLKIIFIFLRQLSLAQANLDYLIKTPENVKKADELMEQEKLLQAHHIIMEIENSRNYLLFQLYIIQEKNSQSDNLKFVTNYFVDYERLAAHLRTMISLRISRWYDCVRSAPEQFITALQIIEREEE